MTKMTVREFMTPVPYTIGVDQTLAVAHRMMREHQIRHLPVLAKGVLVGVVSHRDLGIIEGLPGVDPETVTVDDAMTPEPYTITPDSSLEWVALQMAEHKHGSTVVVERGKVVGVLTTVDALRALSELLGRARRRKRHTNAPRPEGTP
jgi:acetoin utilization protein AcuB